MMTETVLDIRALPGTQEVIAYKDGGLFPVVTKTNAGGMVAVLRGGARHLGLAGRIEIMRCRPMPATPGRRPR